MKKKLIGLFGIVVSGIALASCSSQDSKLSTAKDFDLTMPEVDTNAKLLTEEEKTAIVEDIDSYTPDLNAVKEYMNNYSSIVEVGKITRPSEEGTVERYNKFILDYKNNTYWYYEKQIETVNEEKNINEIETKLVLKDDKYIVRTSLSLDNYNYWILKDDYSYDFYKVSGKGEFYTTIPKDFTENILSVTALQLNHDFYWISKGHKVVISYNSIAESEFYALNNYCYCEDKHGNDIRVRVANDEFFGKYDVGITQNNSNWEYFYEYYLVKNDVLDYSINLSNITEYEYKDTYYYKQHQIPFIKDDVYYQALGSVDIVNSIPREVYESNFTVIKVE